jgi:hypothetical protein
MMLRCRQNDANASTGKLRRIALFIQMVTGTPDVNIWVHLLKWAGQGEDWGVS